MAGIFPEVLQASFTDLPRYNPIQKNPIGRSANTGGSGEARRAAPKRKRRPFVPKVRAAALHMVAWRVGERAETDRYRWREGKLPARCASGRYMRRHRGRWLLLAWRVRSSDGGEASLALHRRKQASALPDGGALSFWGLGSNVDEVAEIGWLRFISGGKRRWDLRSLAGRRRRCGLYIRRRGRFDRRSPGCNGRIGFRGSASSRGLARLGLLGA